MAKKMLCPVCNASAKPKIKTKGSVLIELVLWLCFIVPGIVYSLWRQTTKYKVCPVCGAEGMIPHNSPKAQHLLSTGKEVC